MNKTDFIEAISLEMNVPKVQVKGFIGTFLRVAREELSKEEGMVLFQGFGVFSTWDQTERPGRNPKTGEPCKIPARKSIKFKPSKYFLKSLNKR